MKRKQFIQGSFRQGRTSGDARIHDQERAFHSSYFRTAYRENGSVGRTRHVLKNVRNEDETVRVHRSRH